MSNIDSVSTPSTDTVIDWADQDRQHAALADAIRPANKAALFEALASAGITAVTVQFDGCGDSGQVESIEARMGENLVDLPDAKIEIARSHWGNPEIERSAFSIRDAVEQIAYEFLEETHFGWENNDGAYGEFTIDVAERSITLDYNERISEAIYSQHVF
jgi:hypothetical protein